MSELIRIGQGFFEDLATTPQTKERLLLDSVLSEQEFATKHAETILDHYMRLFRFDFLREDAEFFAATIWQYLQTWRHQERVACEHATYDCNRFSGQPIARWPNRSFGWSGMECAV
ncbi:hypothetical protein SAMN05421644_14028 [Allochromatium warmingii]|uniref:Uncharacterized protein n=1 Tax=Allochromatium warmingii TaxID=61595 RepID=A0A1H3I835_ALLWA|nr:hypothetical protein [Allochromatium warmingii]SDY23308.1 hypothetical protein SAMN05421644_14028 [Allochromatium warmingii]